MIENQNLPQNPGPDPANLTPHEPTEYDLALRGIMDSTHQRLEEIEETWGDMSIREDMKIFNDDSEGMDDTKETFATYEGMLETRAGSITGALSEGGRRVEKILDQNDDDWDAMNGVAELVEEDDFSPEKFAPILNSASSDEARQAILLTQSAALYEYASIELRNQPKPEDFAELVRRNASSPAVEHALRSALDKEVWDMACENNQGRLQQPEQLQKLLEYVSSPQAREDMQLALDYQTGQAHRAVGEVIFSQMDHPERN